MTLLVRDRMTIGVPVCRETEPCGSVAARLAALPCAEVVVALDEDGMASGWARREALAAQPAGRRVGEVMDEAIPSVPPDIPIAAALQLMADRCVDYLFLMHDWPGEPRPSAVIARREIERSLEAQ